MRTSTIVICVSLICMASPAAPQTAQVRTGSAAYGDWQTDAPGVRRHISPSDLPAPKTGTDDETPDFQSTPKVTEPPQDAMPKVPTGFAVQVFARGLSKQPRIMRIAPNGDIFVSESGSGRVLVFRAEAASGASVGPGIFAGKFGAAIRHCVPPACQSCSTSMWRRRIRWIHSPIAVAISKRRALPRSSSRTFRPSGTGRAI